MADRITPEQRSRNMSLIRKFGNRSTEMRMIALFRTNNLKGWRRHVSLPGRPDFVFRDRRVAVFVDGCFWHSCPRCNWTPTSNIRYWSQKFALNRARDRSANRALRASGWQVLRIWEHSLKNPTRVISRLKHLLRTSSQSRTTGSQLCH